MNLTDEVPTAREQAIIDAYRPICLCHKIRKGIITKAIQAGAKTFETVRRRTGAGTGPCRAARCGPMGDKSKIISGIFLTRLKTEFFNSRLNLDKGPPEMQYPS